MPSVPKWIGNTMESILSSKYLTVMVDSAVYINSEVRKVSFLGDFKEISFYPGYAVAFRISDTEFRNYTLSAFDSKKGSCEILFHLHGEGPGSDFAKNIKPGDILKIVIPRGRKMYREQERFHFFFGDETTLGLFRLMATEIKKRKQHYTGILEMNKESLNIAHHLDLAVNVVLKTPQVPALNAVAALNQLQGSISDFLQHGLFYLVGNADSVQQFKKALKLLGIPPKNIRTQIYWAEGKTGL